MLVRSKLSYFGLSRIPTLLSQLSVQPTASYSLRKLNRDATKTINVRRSSDNLAIDIGFNFLGNLDQIALLAHVGVENQFLWSQQFSDANWIKGSGATIDANSADNPFNNATAYQLNTISSTQNYIYQADSTISVKTISIFAKAGTNSYLWIYGGATNNNYGALFDLQNGVVATSNLQGPVTGASNSINSVGNGWYRCSITFTPTAVSYAAFASTNNASPTYSANNDITNGNVGNIFIWGAQLQNQNTLGQYSVTFASANAAGDGYVVTWYDQSGNGYDLTQAVNANQPQIVAAGFVITQGSKPAIYFSGSPRLMSASSWTSSGMFGAVPSSINVVAVSTGAGDQDAFGYGQNLVLGLRSIGGLNSSSGWRSTTSGDITAASPTFGTYAIATNTWDGTTSELFVQGTSKGTSTGAENTPSTSLWMGHRNGGNIFVGYVQGAIVFPAALSTADRQLLERNQGYYYGITVA